MSATSSKDDLHRRIGGRCSTNNMKVVFKVCCASETDSQNATQSSLDGVSKNLLVCQVAIYKFQYKKINKKYLLCYSAANAPTTK